MMRFTDNILNTITMYKLVLYELLFLLVVAAVLGVFGLVPYGPLMLAYGAVLLFVTSCVMNWIFAYFFAAPTNPESTYITALILALIITPPTGFFDPSYFALAGWAAAWSVASKYIFSIRKKHIFNPAAVGVAIPALFLGQAASWWVGTPWMLPAVAVGGFLVARKIRRLDMVGAFIASAIASVVLLSSGGAAGILHSAQQALLYAPLLFLGTVMLTEPMTTPPTRFWRLWYAVLVGFLFAPQVHIGSFYFTPELALLAGNILVYVVSPKVKLLLRLKNRIKLSPDTYEFVFETKQKLKFSAGQYLEWTLAHAHADSRGIRRYFTIASSPLDPDFRIGVKFYDHASTFKKSLLSMKKGDPIVASQLAGDFTLPQDTKKKLVFIAGGIGVTPFRSMLEYLLEKKERRDIILLYSNKTTEDAAYVELLDRAERELGIQTLPIFTNQTPAQAQESGYPYTIDAALIQSCIPDYASRTFYLSGPSGMVHVYGDLLRTVGVARNRIKKDFFPGFA